MPQIPIKQDPTAEKHLATDRQLFQEVEEGLSDYRWRLWEVDRPAVVLGRFGRPAEEVFEARCARDGVPVVRRFSGGGAVVVGRGCLNFCVVFSLARHPELADVPRSFEVVLQRLADALAVDGLLVAGGTDLAIGGRKVSGNAQRRGRRAVVHHGTLLYDDFDPALVTRYLPVPRRQPSYRDGRLHHEFLGCLRVPRDYLTARLSDALANDARFWSRRPLHA